VRARLPTLSLDSIRDAGLVRAEDAAVLEWAARTGHVIITHDVSSMTAAALQRLDRGLPMPGLVIVPQRLGIGEAVRRLVELLSTATADHLASGIFYL
jgi:hypothetical protein